jgi:hypothetical protein
MKPASKTKPAIQPMSLGQGSVKKEFKVVEKQEIKPKQGFTEFPTAKLASIKTVDPFSEKKGNSFAHLYSSGAIPAKIEHGTLHMRLKWNSNVTISRTNQRSFRTSVQPSASHLLRGTHRREAPLRLHRLQC